jgi:GNAT superfamily N-acetyltransferase
MNIRIEALSEKNFADYESLTSCESGGGCYCSFWHQKWASLKDWEECKKNTPEKNRAIVYEKMRSGFHVGVLAYGDNELLAWLSVGPLTDFHWTWKRAIQVGEAAKSIAGITCFTVAPNFRGKGLQSKILKALQTYGREREWNSIEGYPFDPSALEKHQEHVIWPGIAKAYASAGFSRIDAHWLSNAEAERSIYQVKLA